MFILMEDDGTPYGPFDSAQAAVRCDLKSMAIFSLPDYQPRAKTLLDLLSSDLTKTGMVAWWAAATKLVEDVDHVIFEVKLITALTKGEVPDPASLDGDFRTYEALFGCPLISPEKFIKIAEDWAKS